MAVIANNSRDAVLRRGMLLAFGVDIAALLPPELEAAPRRPLCLRTESGVALDVLDFSVSMQRDMIDVTSMEDTARRMMAGPATAVFNFKLAITNDTVLTMPQLFDVPLLFDEVLGGTRVRAKLRLTNVMALAMYEVSAISDGPIEQFAEQAAEPVLLQPTEQSVRRAMNIAGVKP